MSMIPYKVGTELLLTIVEYATLETISALTRTNKVSFQARDHSHRTPIPGQY